MAVFVIYQELLVRRDFIICSKLGRRRTDGICQPGHPQHHGLHPVCQILNIDIAQAAKNFFLALMMRIKEVSNSKTMV